MGDSEVSGTRHMGTVLCVSVEGGQIDKCGEVRVKRTERDRQIERERERWG